MEKYEAVGIRLETFLKELGVKYKVNATDSYMYIYVTSMEDKAKCPYTFEGFSTIIRVVDPKRLPK